MEEKVGDLARDGLAATAARLKADARPSSRLEPCRSWARAL
jgi:hypothetical protein